MAKKLSDLHAAIAAVCPISGVCGYLAEDRSTWTFDPMPDATDEQIKAAEAVIAAFDPTVEPLKTAVLPQDLMALFTPDDALKIKNAIDAKPSLWLLWSSLQTQSEPMEIGNARFKAGWGVLTQTLGPDRMAQIAGELGVDIGSV